MELEPIAMIGVGCRFPGASNPEAFWRMIRDGVAGIREVPASRWDINSYYDRDRTTPGKANTRWGGFLEDIDRFDPQFFGIAPKEAVTMDPQQRLLLEVAWETLEDGGQIPQELRGSKTGVFIGIGTHDYSIMLWQQPVSEPYATTGTGNCIAANRISYSFDFKGPSLAVDTACSSSLVAVHLACQSIWTGESDLALAGGVNVLLLPTIMVGFSKGGFMSGEGRCKSFDANADGYVRGEGAGLILLKPLSQARADGDDIYGVILSSAVNQDGTSQGLAAPNPQAQQAVLQEAYRRGGIDPREVDYVEAHGTGTKVGDPIEANALGTVLGKNRQSKCYIGSVKTNIGHTETAAGIAGIIKVALALKYQQLPPSLNFTTPNPAIAFEDLNLEVVTQLTPWSRDKPRIAGVNSFGFGGTNAHVVLADVPGCEGAATQRSEDLKKTEIDSASLYLFTISAKNKTALRELADKYRDFIGNTDYSLAEICTTTQTRRSHFNHRLSCMAKSLPQLQQQLAAFSADREAMGLQESVTSDRSQKICWLFTGQGSQYAGMGRQLYDTQPVFRKALERCGNILEPYLDKPLLEVIYPAFKVKSQKLELKSNNSSQISESSIDRTVYTQPAIFALEYALAQLWLSWGIEPDYVAGHSIGEYVAACIAGVFSLEDGLRLVATRGRLMEELPTSGRMLAIFSSQQRVNELIASWKLDVNIAAVNNRQNTVIAGNSQTLEVIREKLAKLDINSSLLEVSQAFHSPLMQPMLADFKSAAETVIYSQPQIPLVSNVTANIAGTEITTADYWVTHIIKPVRFADGFQFLLQQGVDVFLEIGAKPILSSIGTTILTSATEYSSLLLPSLSPKQEDRQVLLNSTARLYHRGIKINWRAFHQNYLPSVKLPTYPFQRQRYWWDKAKFWTQDNARRRSDFHPLLGDLITDDASEVRFQGRVNAQSPEYLIDHCLLSQTVFPATAYLEMALAAGQYVYSDRSLQLEQLAIARPLILMDKDTLLETVLSVIDDVAYRVQIYSRTADEELVLHCEARIKTHSIEPNSIDLARLKDLLQPDSNITGYYQKLSRQGLNYGASFQGIEQIWRGDREALGYIKIPDSISLDGYHLHPALMDACLQVIGTVTEAEAGVYLPVSIETFSLFQTQSDRLWTHVTIQDSQRSQITADLALYNDAGKLVARLSGLSLQYLSLPSLRRLIDLPPQENIDRWLYKIDWEAKALLSNSSLASNDTWLIFAEKNPISQELAEKLGGILVVKSDRFMGHSPIRYTINPERQEDYRRLWQALDNTAKNLNIVYLGDETSIPVENRDCACIFHLMQSLAEETAKPQQLIIVTQQSQYQVNHLTGIWGLGRAIALEYPSLTCRLIDFDSIGSDNFVSQLISELLARDNETQIAYEDDRRYVARLTPRDDTLARPYRLQLTDYGTLDNLTLVPLTRRLPQAGEIEIAVTASGVNFRDVLNALGMLTEYLEAMGFTDSTQVPFGGECVGVVVAVGEGVSNFQVGDEVIAAQAVGSLGSHVIVDAKLAIAKPERLSYTEAATIPTTFLTAYYGLHHLAQIEPGDKILIHAAAGGVGQAAVQLAQQIGAEVYATASEGKWDFLKSSGVKYVMNSRNLDFAEEVMQLTDGAGVDLILNSLNGEFIPKNLEILAPQGRFVEIGKVGIWSRDRVAEMRGDISYFPFDLLEVSRREPDLIATLFAQLKQQFIEGKLQPLPHKVFPITQANAAFRYMARAKHTGKVVISTPVGNQIVKAEGSYLITGGWGALGLEVARWLAAEGAKHLILLGRSQPVPSARQVITELEREGITVDVIPIDIADYEAVQKIVDNFSTLKGIVHAAGVLDDGLLETLTWERFHKVLQPKAIGAWNLHRATEKLALDWFVCFSSIVSVLGAAGQSNYGAANAFMDNLMRYRRNQGLPGLSINWSIWGEVGMASRLTSKQQQRLQQQGLTAIAPPQGLQVLKQLLQQTAPTTPQTIVFPVNWETFLRQHSHNSFFKRLQPQAIAPIASTSFLQQLAQTPADRQFEVLQEHIRYQIAKVLGFGDPEDIDPQEKFADLGMDSLMAVEFKNNLQASFGDGISLTAAFDYPNVELLAQYVWQQLSAIPDLKPEVAPAIKPRSPKSKQKRQNTLIKPAPPVVKRTKPQIDPKYSQFPLTPEYLNLKQDLARVKQLGNPFFTLHRGIARDIIQTGDRQLINFSSYNYLGMSGDPRVIAATQQAIAQYGTSVSASRVLSGERPIHLELERAIANLIGAEAAITFVGGHATNVSTIGHLFGENDLIICDALSHNSIREGCNLSGATVIDFPHNDIQVLAAILERERTNYQKVLIAVEGIYSTDGDLAPLPEIVELKHHYQTFLLVDEAHSIGVLGLSGGGIREHFNLQSTDVDLWMGTLSKSFASCGGYLAGCGELIEYLKYTAPGFVFSVGMSPANTASALAAIELLQSEPERAIKLQNRAKFCLDLAKNKGFNTGSSGNSPIVPIIVGEPHKAVRLSQLLGKSGINVTPMVYPSVPYDASRLRLFITCLHTEAQIQTTIASLSQAIALAD